MNILNVSQASLLQDKISTQKLDGKESTDFNLALNKAMESNDDKQLKEACDELEGYMISMLFKQMKSSMLSGDSLIKKGDYESMFEGMHIDNLSKEMVKAGGIGLSDSMYRQMKQTYAAQMQITPSK